MDLPNRVTASGGRYQFKDDWQFYDTLDTSFEYDDKLISWDNKSCNGMKIYNRDRGVVVVGTTGSVVVDTGGYEVYDLKGVKTSEHMVGKAAASSDTRGADSMTDLHFTNFIAAIRTGQKLTQPVESGNVTVTMMQLSNIAWEVQRELKLDPGNGRILDDRDAMKSWDREYEKGWAPSL